jgi:hypothetical protein
MQSSRDLRFFLASGPVSLQSFHILKSHQAKWRGFRFSFYVLAVSHALSIEYENQRLTELLSCVPIQMTAHIIKDISVLRLPWEFTNRVYGMDYSCRLTLADSKDGGAFRCPFDAGNQITAHYPISPGFPTPITRIGWRLGLAEALVETIHSYPEENRVVRSESVFRFSPDQA